jgi:hypothetical protein
MISSSIDIFMANFWYLVTEAARLCMFLNGSTRMVIMPKNAAGIKVP